MLSTSAESPSSHPPLKIEQLLQEIAVLRQEIIELTSEKADLELRLEMTTYHSDFVTDELLTKVEATLRESAKKFRSIAETTPVPVVVSQIADGKIIYANRLAGPFVNLPTADLLGRHTSAFYGDQSHRQPLLDLLNRQGYVNDYELQGRKANGELFWVSVSIQPLTFEDKPCLLSVFYDLTERKQAEEKRTRLATIEQELYLAQQIQERLLPPSQPHWPELDVICYMASAHNVGGDFYAYHPLGIALSSSKRLATAAIPKRFALAVGDVSGKGMPAALLMSLSFASLQALIDQPLEPGELLTRLDQTITQYTRTTYQNCALCYAEITRSPFTPKNKGWNFRIANAGCMPPIIRRSNNAVKWVDVVGLPLGVGLTDRMIYGEATVTLTPGDFIIFSTDGVVEAVTEEREMFGFERFERTIATGPTTNAAAMLAHIRAEINTFTHHAELQDDLTIVVIQV